MQPSLSFARITAHDAALQRQRIAQEVAALPAHVAPAPAPKRPVGRPKRERDAPDDRYARLTNCTVAAWFINRELLPHLQNQLAANQAPRGNGPAPVFAAAPDVESVIVKTLCQMREAGTPLNSRIIRFVMQAIIKDKQPALLDSLTLSQSFISKWVTKTLQWTWRARTTAASKLPVDWEDPLPLPSPLVSISPSATITGAPSRRCRATSRR